MPHPTTKSELEAAPAGSALPPDWVAVQAALRARWSRLPASQQLQILAAQRAGRHATTAAHERLMADDDPRYRAAAAFHLRVARVADPAAARQVYLESRAFHRALSNPTACRAGRSPLAGPGFFGRGRAS